MNLSEIYVVKLNVCERIVYWTTRLVGNTNHIKAKLTSNVNRIQFWVTFDIKHQPDRVLVDV